MEITIKNKSGQVYKLTVREFIDGFDKFLKKTGDPEDVVNAYDLADFLSTYEEEVKTEDDYGFLQSTNENSI